MSTQQLHIGSTPIHAASPDGKGKFVEINDEIFYQISGIDTMPPFLVTVVSPNNHYMFIGSNGALTAGRKNPESALFPYYTDDKILDSADITGSKTLLQVRLGDKTYLWEPFSDKYAGAYRIKRNLYKNRAGNKLLFQETNEDLQICFSYMWMFSNKYGFVKQSILKNLGEAEAHITLLDGLQNLLPPGVNSNLQGIRSTLVDAYKKNELVPETGLGVFALSAMIVDKAEPSEALKATTVWSSGLENAQYLLSATQLNAFRTGAPITQETFTKAIKAAYFVHAALTLAAGTHKQWLTVAEVNQSTAAVLDLNLQLSQNQNLLADVLADVEKGRRDLVRLVGLSDGLQLTEDRLSTGRHYANVLFNIMRGGIFEDQYQLDKSDLMAYAKTINKKVYSAEKQWFAQLPDAISYADLVARATAENNPHLKRICVEYLPLSFSRRHGDPSRPWNYFTIDLVDENGHKKHNYEGNWRDIFQNWEALAYSFPAFIRGMIAKFVNASTIDGYNPYRITRDGIDWEIIEPDDPWSYIGYWGDHQVIYLQKLMEHAQRHYPGLLAELLTDESFVYANVPYIIKDYAAICRNPNDTIDFDHHRHQATLQKEESVGADGKMVWQGDALLTANFAEKLLVMVLTKLYNFVPDGGLWLNTQRPEWNDANNALVGNGLSMVTLNYLSRNLKFLQSVFAASRDGEVKLHQPVAQLLQAVHQTFASAPDAFDPRTRKAFVDALGNAGSAYRTQAYAGFSDEKAKVSTSQIVDFLATATNLINKTIAAGKREDGLYHAYNILQFKGDEAHVSYLYEMLEGQVAALSSGLLPPEEAVNVLHALKASAMFRPDQYSYMLYPDRVLPTFIAKNNIPETYSGASSLFARLKSVANNGLVQYDAQGNPHFDGNLHNADDVRSVLQRLKSQNAVAVSAEDEENALAAFEAVFNHVAFTGRSGTFYGYEGLGSIYWHMVSKLLLAVQENIYWAEKKGADWGVIGQLIEHYYEIRAGIGINKDPGLYGAFPTDAYSHTPGNAGAQQPGLTGQVKEDVINRWAEMGIQVVEGKITFNPILLHREEFLDQASTFTYIGVDGARHETEVSAGELAFTYCGTLIKYRRGENSQLVVKQSDSEKVLHGLQLDAATSAAIFARSGQIKEIDVQHAF